MQDVSEVEQSIRYCVICDYVLLDDYAKLQYVHRQNCSILKAGGDCMHFEADKTYCKCVKNGDLFDLHGEIVR